MNANTALKFASLAEYDANWAKWQAQLIGQVRRSSIILNHEPQATKSSVGLEGRIWLQFIPSVGVIYKSAAPYNRDGEAVSPAELAELRNQAVCVGVIAEYPQGQQFHPANPAGAEIAGQQMFAIDEANFDFVVGLTPVERTRVWLCLAVPLM